MEKCIGVINSGFTNETFNSLCKTRPVYMLPFGGRYRIVDFSLSSMSNHNFSSVLLYGGKNIRSTLDHIGNGQPWELNRRRNGLMIFPPVVENEFEKQSNILVYYQTLPYFEYSKNENIYIDNPMTIAKINLDLPFEKFKKENLDVLLLYKRQKDFTGKYINCDKLILNENGELHNIGINLGTENEFNLYLNKAFIKKDAFIRIVKDATERGDASNLRNGFINHKDSLRIGTYEVKSHVEVVHDLTSYYQANMNLLDMSIYDELFTGEYPVFTKSKDEPSTLYAEDSKVCNSLIANGCIIKGHVENSIIFRGVNIGPNAIVKNSIIIQKSQIGESSIVVNVISDKYGVVKDGVTVVGSAIQPYVIKKDMVIKKGQQ